MTTFGELFPRLCAILANGSDTPPPAFTWAEIENVRSLIALVTARQNAVARDLDALNAFSLAIYEDIQAQRPRVAEPAQLSVCDFFQFWLVILPLMVAARRRRTPIARDWAYRALVDDFRSDELGASIHIERLPTFTTVADGQLVDLAITTVLEYTEVLFYLGRVTGDLFDITVPLVPYLHDLVGRLLVTSVEHQVILDPVLDAAVSMLAWLDVHDEGRAQAFAVTLAAIEDDERYPEAQRVRVALMLSDPPGRHTALTLAERARRSLDRYDHRLVAQERLGLLKSAHGGSVGEIMAHLDELLGAIDEYSRFLEEQSATVVDRLYDRGRLFRGYLGGVIRTLAAAGETTAACRLIGRWQGVDDVREDIVLLLAADPEGSLWTTRGCVRPGSTDRDSLGELIAAANRALGLATTYVDAGEAGTPEAVERPGVPDPEQAAAYERACERHLGLHGLGELVAGGATGGLVVVPGLAVPFCALAHRSTDRAWPLATSLRAPFADRPLTRVAIWPTAAAVVDEEVEALLGLFGAAGIEIEVVRDERTASRFRDLYVRDDLDVIWVTCHGEKELFHPEQSRLILSEDGDGLGLEEILTLPAPAGCKRRLLFVNACDSAAAATLGGSAEFGIGAAFAGPTQAVVGHLWPIGVVEAAGFGAVVASRLAAGVGFCVSFGYGLRALRGGAQGLLDALGDAEVAGELPQRLQRAVDRPTDILSWGSPAILE